MLRGLYPLDKFISIRFAVLRSCITDINRLIWEGFQCYRYGEKIGLDHHCSQWVLRIWWGINMTGITSKHSDTVRWVGHCCFHSDEVRHGTVNKFSGKNKMKWIWPCGTAINVPAPRLFSSLCCPQYNDVQETYFPLILCTKLWSSSQSSWLQFPALTDFLRNIESGTGSTQPPEYNWGATWMED
jgi:hypothetical protein